MRGFGKFVKLLLHLVLPQGAFDAVNYRIDKTKQAMTSQLYLRIFWKILFFPIMLIFYLLEAAAKTVATWVLPARTYNNLYSLLQLFDQDINFSKYGLRKALRRARIYRKLLATKYEEKASFGNKNPDKTFYVIRPHYVLETSELHNTFINLIGHYYFTLQHLAYAVVNGWIPVVDWENYGPLVHGEEYPINGTMNCWEYYWNQPSKYTLEEVYQSKNVVLSDRDWRAEDTLIPPAVIQLPLQAYAQAHVRLCPRYSQLITLNDFTAEYVKEKQDMLFPKGAKILGVSLRAQEAYRAFLHPVQPDIPELIRYIRWAMEEWEMDYFFFVCENESPVNMIKETFKEKALVLPRMRRKIEPTEGEDPLYKSGQRYQTNLDYLTEVALLSRCNSLIASFSGGTRTAIIWNANEYENMHIIDLGVWPATKAYGYGV